MLELITIGAVVQGLIFTLGVSSVGLLALKDAKWRRWGYVVAIVNEPFWIISAVQASQWGIVGLACLYAVGYTVGAINNWRAK